MTAHKFYRAEWQFRDSRIGRSPGYCSLLRDASALWVAFQLRPLCIQTMGGNRDVFQTKWILEEE
jgi:hypothetical protein